MPKTYITEKIAYLTHAAVKIEYPYIHFKRLKLVSYLSAFTKSIQYVSKTFM
jgi:hypothetical protein